MCFTSKGIENSTYHFKISPTTTTIIQALAPVEILYGKLCITPLSKDEIGEIKLVGLEYVHMTINKTRVIRNRQNATQDRRRSILIQGEKFLSPKLMI